MTRNEHQYDDIIHLPHHVSVKHPQMSPLDRAAQFSPFAALTGHGAAIRETARLTDDFIELDDSQKEQLDLELQRLRKDLPRNPEIKITYFQPDQRKDGGSYVTVRGIVKKIDEYRHLLLFADGTTLPMEDILSIERATDLP